MTGELADTTSDRVHPTVGSASVTTSRSSLDLFELPYPFSQAKLLTPSEFGKLAEQRRNRAEQGLPPVNEQVLEELHRCSVLVPLLRVDLVASGDVPGIDLSTSLSAKHLHTSMINEVLRGAAEGRVIDPAGVDFTPWPRDRRRQLWPSVDSGYLYSRHQLLGLDVAMPFVKKLTGRREDRRVIYELEEGSLPNVPTREALASWRSLAIVLSALDTNYWPQVTHILHGDFKVWRSALAALDPPAMLGWLGLTLDRLDPQIISLLATASFRDDTGEFYELIRRAKAEAWDRLRGDIAVAMDYRQAADVLVHFAGDLDPDGDHDAKEQSLAMQALSARAESLDAVLTDLRLSPFPSLVIGVEGATEYLLVPRVMRLLGIEWDRNRIEIVDFGGTDRDLALLARYAAEPLLGRDLGIGVCLDRPLTKFLVMTDAEHKYRSAACRRYQRKLLLDSLTVNVPTDLRADYYNNHRRDRVVEIVTWGKLPFEFAHFKDRELADAMCKVAKVPYPHDRARLIHGLHMQRTQNAAPDVEDVFWRGSGLSKTVLAEALRPVLEGKIEMAIEQGTPGPPVMRACARAYEMLAASEGKAWMLRRRRWRPRK